MGFRYTACCTARNYGISGWVKNLDDGSVEMEAEGRSADIDALVHSLEQLLDQEIPFISVGAGREEYFTKEAWV